MTHELPGLRQQIEQLRVTQQERHEEHAYLINSPVVSMLAVAARILDDFYCGDVILTITDIKNAFCILRSTSNFHGDFNRTHMKGRERELSTLGMKLQSQQKETLIGELQESPTTIAKLLSTTKML